MNTIARRSMGALGALVAGVALGAGLLTAQSGGRVTEFVGVVRRRMLHLTDGQHSYQAACGRSDGYFNFYVRDAFGDWVYNLSGGQDIYGCTVAFNNVGGFGSSCFPDPALGVIGGATGTPTGHPVVDVIWADGNNDVIDTALQPVCIEIVADTCYTEYDNANMTNPWPARPKCRSTRGFRWARRNSDPGPLP